MNRPWLLIDVSCLAYRAFHALGDLGYGGESTAVVYGMLRAVIDLQQLHSTNRVVFCFDRGYGKRLEVDDEYKANRRTDEKSEEELEAYRDLRQQLYRLRVRHLPAAGFRNVCWQDDYEADDVIASICQQLPHGQTAVVVSTDGDLYQLLSDNRVVIWSPSKKKAITAESFRREWGIDPTLWADVKAIAGCTGDNVRGVKGVGEKTAVKFLTGTLKISSKAYGEIIRHQKLWEHNLRLVRLPFPGIGSFELIEDEVDDNRWRRLTERLGLRSLMDRRVG